jgi:tetratricopeptide (TPR) repeat protein
MTERARRDLDAGRTDEALELLEQAMQVDPDAPFAYYYMAGVYLQRGRADEAEVLAQRAATLSDGFPAAWSAHAHALRGRALQVLGKRDEALRAYRAALAADPNNQPARDALRELGD